MTPYQTSALLGLAIAGGILLLVRRDHLHGSFAAWWLTVAAATLVVGFFPGIVDRIGAWFGISYPPILVVLVVLGALLLKQLALDLHVTRRERRLRRVLQKVAILEAELHELRARLDAGDSAPSAPGRAGEPEADGPASRRRAAG
ncbi:MAG TPA: DUF2304 domain-containing protein [Xanthomonadaceae bacterium]|nr:DUF2304 domain-containing protein [Xanthomonadaceae bacterium]